MMDCLEAQGIISQALDKVPVDDVSVEKAKLHCTTCAECNQFVRAIASTLRAGTPEPPVDLADRVMAAVRAEAESQAVRRATSDAAGTHTASPEAPAIVSPVSAVRPAHRPSQEPDGAVVNLRDPATRRSLAAWGAAAAVVLIAAGIFANQGVRQILTPTTTTMTTSSDSGLQEGTVADKSSTGVTTAPQQFGSGAERSIAPSATAGDYIAVNGVAYRRAGTAPDVDPKDLTKVGLTSSSLDKKTAPLSVELLGGTDPSRVYVRKPDATLLAFDRVTREYQGRQYALQTGPIPSFGAWPTYPSGVGKPTADSGAPVFKPIGADTSGAQLFEPNAGGAGVGIAVAPGSPAADMAQGNPDWTWWVPVR